jgi:hypothetical protein
MIRRPKQRKLRLVIYGLTLGFGLWTSGCTGLRSGAPTNTQASSVTISPSSASSASGARIQFAAQLQGKGTNAQLQWAAKLGKITPSGLYTAPASAGTDVVTATLIGGTSELASATVTIQASEARVTSINVSPTSASSVTTGTLPFTAVVEGNVANKSVTWTASMGSINAEGQYTAPAVHGIAIVTATSNADPTKSGHATVTVMVAPPPPPLQPPVTPAPVPIARAALPATFFGQNLSVTGLIETSHYPTVPFGSLRLWDTHTHWMDIETSRGAYTWATLDAWLALAHAQGKDVLYTFGKTPQWASMRPAESCTPAPTMGCAAPASDVDSDDELWKEFVTALVKHSLASSPHISFYEIWNEANLGFWTGTDSQMVRMAKDAYNIIHTLDPNAVVLSPSVSGGPGGLDWLTGYFAAGGAAADAQDIVAYHAYAYDTRREPTALPATIDTIRGLMSANGIGNEQLWFTEGSWGNPKLSPFFSPQEEAAYLAQQYIFMWAKRVSRYYWFTWDSPTFGTLWDPLNGIHPAGVAYGRLYNWLVGSVHPDEPCSQDSNGTWTCTLTLASGKPAEIVWNPNASTRLPVNSTFTAYETLDNNTANPIVGNTITAGSKPILLN